MTPSHLRLILLESLTLRGWWQANGGWGVHTQVESSWPRATQTAGLWLKAAMWFPPAHVFRLNSGKNVKAGRGERERRRSPMYVEEPTGPSVVEHVGLSEVRSPSRLVAASRQEVVILHTSCLLRAHFLQLLSGSYPCLLCSLFYFVAHF